MKQILVQRHNLRLLDEARSQGTLSTPEQNPGDLKLFLIVHPLETAAPRGDLSAPSRATGLQVLRSTN